MTRHAGPRTKTDGFYVWRPPNHAAASVAVQSRWGNLYDAPATIRSLVVDVYRHAHVFAHIEAPTAAAVADRLPGQSFRLRVPNLPAPPFRGRCRVLLSLGEVTDLVIAHVNRPPNVVKQAARTIRLLVDATADRGSALGTSTDASASRWE